MQIINRSFNRAHHHHCSPHRSNGKRHMKRHAHHRVRMELRAAISLGDWEMAQTPMLTRPATSWDVT
jgi:hypothetical protein